MILKTPLSYTCVKHFSCIISANDQAPFCNRQCERRLWSANHGLGGTDGLTNVNSSPALCASHCQIMVRAEGAAHLGSWQTAVGTTEMEKNSKLIKALMTISSTRHCWFGFVLFNCLACTTLTAKFPIGNSRCFASEYLRSAADYWGKVHLPQTALWSIC